MTQFSVNAQRLDPYKNFKFRVQWDGRYVAGISAVSGLVRSTDVIEHREGGDPSVQHKSPGATRFAAVRLERGVSHDSAFEDWANAVWRHGTGRGAEVALANFRKDVRIELYNEAGQLVLAYNLYRCWPSEYVALPDLDANTGGIAIQVLTLQVEGWARDTDVSEPAEPKAN